MKTVESGVKYFRFNSPQESFPAILSSEFFSPFPCGISTIPPYDRR